MRLTLDLDSDLLRDAQRLIGMAEPTAIIHAALRALIQRESARRLASLGATDPSLSRPPRRRARRSAGK